MNEKRDRPTLSNQPKFPDDFVEEDLYIGRQDAEPCVEDNTVLYRDYLFRMGITAALGGDVGDLKPLPLQLRGGSVSEFLAFRLECGKFLQDQHRAILERMKLRHMPDGGKWTDGAATPPLSA